MQTYVIIIFLESSLIILALVALLSQKRKLDKLLESMKSLQELEKNQVEQQHQRDDYIAMLVHELRAPLAVIKGAADLVIREAQNLSKEQIETLLGQIKKSSSGLLQIVNDILDVSKLESGKFSINKAENDLNPVLKEVAEYYLSWANEKQIKINFNLEENLPKIKFDPERIKQVLNNLISNALKFTDEYGVIEIRSNLTPQTVQVAVLDNGIGIPEELKHKLFNKFVQLGNKKNLKEKGTGLGLFISKGIVEAHGGNIWIEDNSPQGTKFVFSIPLNA